MAKFAFLINNIVVETKDINEEAALLEETKKYELVFDITDLLISPQVGWILQGNQLTPPAGQMVNLKELIKARIKYYQDSASELLRDLYAENTLLGITAAQSDQMFDDYQDVLIRIREGAWPTAIYRLQQKQPSGFVTQEMIDAWTALIQSRIIQ